MELLNNKAIVLTKHYYNNIFKKEYSLKDFIDTANTIDYLLDCKFKSSDILKELAKQNKACIRYENLSDSLWEKSLVKRDAYYLHKELRLEAPVPVYDFKTDTVISHPYYCEMKIKYTDKDVLNYFRSKLSTLGRQLEEEKVDIGAINYLMEKYKMVDWVEPLDIILCSIDNHIQQNPDCYRIIEISNTNQEVIKNLQADMLALESKDNRKMVWRRKCLT